MGNKLLYLSLVICLAITWLFPGVLRGQDRLEQQNQLVAQTGQPEDDNWIEIGIVVHGITPNRHVPVQDPGYLRFQENMRRTFFRLGLDEQFDYPFGEHNLIFTKYGTAETEKLIGDNPSNLLEETQQIIGDFDFNIWVDTKDSPESLLRQTAFKATREIMLYGISDAFYYTSDSGGKAIRAAILKQVYRGLADCNVIDENGVVPEPYKVSFTIFSHSLGAIVMYDLLNLIYSDESLEDSVSDAEALAYLQGFSKLRSAGRVRIRKFFTMGTQLPVLFLRYPNAIEDINTGVLQRLDHIFPEDAGVEDPRWINIWDKDDILGYPFAYLFRPRPGSGSRILIDKAVDVGDYVPHIAYWWSEEVAETVLSYFYGLSMEDFDEIR